MDVQYGISITNKYDLFFDEDQDPLELISAQKTGAATKEEKAAKKKEKKQLKSAKEAAPVAPAPVIPAKGVKPPVKPTSDGKVEHREGPDEKENKPTAPRRGGRGAPGGGEQRPPRPPRQEGEGPKRGGFGGQYQDDVPPRFAGSQDDRGNFGDRFGERGPPGERGRGRGRGGPRGRGRGEGRGGRGGFGGADAPEGGGDIFQQADDNSWNAGGTEAPARGGFPPRPQMNPDESHGGFGHTDGGGRGGFGTFGDEETERLSGARPPNRGGFGNRGGRGRGGFGGPRGDFRGGRGGRGGRQFDRHSGSDTTGIKPMEKREGGGPHNWGTINDELTGETDAANVTAGSDDVPVADNVERVEVREGEGEPHEEPVQEFTLDEWKALQLKEKEAKPQFNIRKPGDGEDPALWKKLIPLTREKPKDATKKKAAQDEAEEEEDEESHPRKQLLNIEINFIDTAGHGGGRGAPRGGPRGFGRGRGVGEGRGAPMMRGRGGVDRGGPGVGRGGGGGRGAGGPRRGENFKMDDESFPELSSPAGPTA